MFSVSLTLPDFHFCVECDYEDEQSMW